MAFVRRPPSSPFPDDMVRWLDLFGRYSFDVHGSGIDDSSMWERVGSLYRYATSDREGFLAALGDLVADDQGGFATFGAARLVWEMFSGDALTMPAALPLIDAGIAFQAARGLPVALLTGYEQQRLQQIRAERG
ncbi:hypothetical protein ABZU22_17035 [Micromonospora sp. NPDC005222]|uniref:hypothetical protein n=1 Tax=unclassified Micromonospora TaxID=2617518 RepID=UPI0033B58A78